PGEGVVVAGMLEAFLQRLVLLHLVEQPLVDRVQPFAHLHERALRAPHARRQLVRAEDERPAQEQEKTRLGREVPYRVPARPRPMRERPPQPSPAGPRRPRKPRSSTGRRSARDRRTRPPRARPPPSPPIRSRAQG